MDILVLDLSTIQAGDTGDTTHYGGFYTIKGSMSTKGTHWNKEIDEEFPGFGCDRGDNQYDDIFDKLRNLGLNVDEVEDEEMSWLEKKYLIKVEDWDVILIEEENKQVYLPADMIEHIELEKEHTKLKKELISRPSKFSNFIVSLITSFLVVMTIELYKRLS